MSCMISNPTIISTLAEAIATILNHGYNYVGFSAPSSLVYALDGCRKSGYYNRESIFRRLYALNAAAFNGRYTEGAEEIFEGEIPQPAILLHPREMIAIDNEKAYVTRRQKIDPDHFRLLRLVEYVEYQCSEDATCNDALYLALVELENVLQAFIIHNNPRYITLPWGEV